MKTISYIMMIGGLVFSFVSFAFLDYFDGVLIGLVMTSLGSLVYSFYKRKKENV